MQNFDFKSGFKNFLSTFLWGNSVALAWTWGIGLFFSVQVAIQFGFKALITFATIDAVGLTLFGVINTWIARRYSTAENFEVMFLEKAKNFKLAFLFYQFLAITLTLYACFKYVSMPLGILSILVAGVFFGATIFLGEEFPIQKIKYSHAVCGFLILTSLIVLANSEIFNLNSLFSAALSTSDFGLTAQFAINKDFWSWLDPFWNFRPIYSFNSGISATMFWVPIAIGFLCGPWLDLQNWQRVIQIKKENLSTTQAYIIGGILFWGILMADGMLAIACFEQGFGFLPELMIPSTHIEPTSLLYSFKSIITTVLNSGFTPNHLLAFYLVFIGLSALTTFDSGYIAYKWYSENLVKDSKSLLFSFVPTKAFSSPIPAFLLCIITAVCTLHFTEIGKFLSRFDINLESFFRIELEYYLAFFAAFFTIYAVVFYRNISNEGSEKFFSSLKLFATALCSLATFGIGYFGENFIIMAFGSAVPFIYGWFMIAKQEILIAKPEEPSAELVSNTKLLAPTPGTSINLDQPNLNAEQLQSLNLTQLPPGASPVGIKGCYIKDGWFVHHFIPTYQDTNSVGNIYFAMYLLWVGKTRELFFMHTMPDFDPKTSEFLILTRSIEHKFLKEIKEFDEVSIEIRISDYNRKFVTLEHRILDLHGDTVGKGKQVLMFVRSKDYALIDLPEAIQKVYMKYVAEVKDVKFRN